MCKHNSMKQNELECCSVCGLPYTHPHTSYYPHSNKKPNILRQPKYYFSCCLPPPALRQITYWLQFLESHHVPGTSAPHVIIIGSHKDILKRQVPDSYKKRISTILKNQLPVSYKKTTSTILRKPLPDSYKTKISAVESLVKRKIVSDTSLHFAGFFAVDCR